MNINYELYLNIGQLNMLNIKYLYNIIIFNTYDL